MGFPAINGTDVEAFVVNEGKILSVRGNNSIRQLILWRVECHLAFGHTEVRSRLRGPGQAVGKAQDDQQRRHKQSVKGSLDAHMKSLRGSFYRTRREVTRLAVALEALKVSAKLGSELAADPAVFLQTFVDDLFQFLGNLRVETNRRDWLSIKPKFDQVRDVFYWFPEG